MNVINSKTAFTLVELLVVITIIGILSGLIIVGMNSSVQQATIAKAQVFSASLRDSLLASLISDWKLDGNGNDLWGNNNCTWSGAGSGANTSANWRPVSECIYSQCLNFDGTDDYLDCGTDTDLNINGPVTMEAWIKANNVSSENQIMAKHDATGYHMANYGMEIRSGVLRVWFGDGTNHRLYEGGSVKSNTWIHVAATIISSNNIKAYINGIEIAGTYSGTATTMATNNRILKIGLKTTSVGLAGYLDGIRLYNNAISGSLIKDNYYSGINRLLSSGKIGKIDYSEKLKNIN